MRRRSRVLPATITRIHVPDAAATRSESGTRRTHITPWEVANAAVWLLSGESSYVNAHPLILDDGATSFG